ncbi:hypothetical protein EUTSA_v10005398mg [Eutrema salsugineum]|uniref:F-box associated beta-propeller type 3 domain-containing protein n=1 Tax=Eutrema salsugineum TaxID=72664 RepID=V4MLV1_EUTSA|nr:hypothetical protein EUTSA_v10005398mg [Eutrema salsugineum]
MEILKKIPGKEALICRCVSKTFLSMIDSRCVVCAYDEPPSLLAYGFQSEAVFFKLWMCKTSLMKEDSDHHEANNVVLKVEDRSLWNYPCMERPLNDIPPISSNGLILTRCGSDTYVFNPVGKEAMKIPCQEHDNACKQPLGFGYDLKGKTHKIISVWETPELKLVAQVFSLRETDYNWRSLDISSSFSSSALPFGHVSFSSSTVTIHGYVYWTATISKGSQAVCSCGRYAYESLVENENWTKHMVLCFNLEMETFEWFSHPALIHGGLVQLFHLTDLQGTLAMVDFSSEECVETKVKNFCRGHEWSTRRLHMVGAWKEGLRVRIWQSTVCVYLNFKTQRMEYIGFEDEIQELISRDFIVIICARPLAGARIRGRLHYMVTRADNLFYEFRYLYDSLKTPFDELIGFRIRKTRLEKHELAKFPRRTWVFE